MTALVAPATAVSAADAVDGPVSPVVDYDRSMRCMTQAIYYEAGSEPVAGRRAVAQVVLNRIGHPAFPKTVCGVVYQGAWRTTGCQFTFVCDGSLARPPVPERWEQARVIAADALSGHMEDPVGAATHYHAAWMTPYWQSSFVETARIGGHIFYQAAGEPVLSEATGAVRGDTQGGTTVVSSKSARTRRNRGVAVAVSYPQARPADFSVWGLRIATVTPADLQATRNAAQ